jgi:hypothetical protein
MSRLRPNWLNGIVTNLEGINEDELGSAKLLVTRNGQVLTEGGDYTYDGTNLHFMIDILSDDVILLIDPSIGAVRCLRGGSNCLIDDEPELFEVAPDPALEPEQTDPVVDTPVTPEDTDVTSSDTGRNDEESEAPADHNLSSRKRSSRRRRT